MAIPGWFRMLHLVVTGGSSITPDAEENIIRLIQKDLSLNYDRALSVYGHAIEVILKPAGAFTVSSNGAS